MNQIEKLKKLVNEYENKAGDLFKEASIARRHNYQLEAMLFDEKYKLVRDMCMEIRMKVIEELIN